VDSSGENSKATIIGTYIISINGSISSISVRNKSLDAVSESFIVTPMKYPTVPSTQSSNSGTTMIATPSISNLKSQNRHLTGTIDVTVGGIFSWDIIGFDIDLNNRSLDWWWIK